MCTNRLFDTSLGCSLKMVLLFLVAFIFSMSAFAVDNTLYLNNDSSSVTPESGQISLWVEEESVGKGRSIIDGLRSVAWKSTDGRVPNLGYSLEVHWFRIKTHNQSRATDWLLAVEYPLISSLDVYQVVTNNVVSLIQAGDRFEFNARPITHRNFIIPLQLNSNERSDIYIRVESEYAIQLPVTIVRSSTFWEREAMESLAHGLFFGFLILMILYNLFLFFATRDIAYFHYVVFSMCVGLFQLSQQGFGYQYIWPTNIWLQHHIVPAACCLAFVSAALFVQSFLNTRRFLPKLHKLLNVLLLSGVVLCVLAVFVDEHLVQWGNAYLGAIGSLIMFVVGVFGWKQGIKEARFFVLAWFVFLLSIMSFAGNKLGFLPRNVWTEFGMQIGTALELTLLSFALADRINASRIKQEQLLQEAKTYEQIAKAANERALDVERMGKNRLEKNIQSRTEQLQHALKELSVANKQLEEMSTVDSLTGARSLAFFQEKAEEEWERCAREQHNLTLMLVSIDQFELIGDRYGYVAAEEILKNVFSMVRQRVTRPADSIGRVATAEFGVLMPNTNLSGGRHVAKKVYKDVASEPLNLGVCSISVTVSISVITTTPDRERAAEELFDDAQALLMSAIESGGNIILTDIISNESLA